MKTLFVLFAFLFSTSLEAACNLKNDKIQIETKAIKGYLETCVIPAFKKVGFHNSGLDKVTVVIKKQDDSLSLASYQSGSLYVYDDGIEEEVEASTLVHEMAHAWDFFDARSYNVICSFDEKIPETDVRRWTVGESPVVDKKATRPSGYSNENGKEFIAEVITAIVLNDSWATKKNVDSVFSARDVCRKAK